MSSFSERPSILDNPRADRVKKVAALAGRSARSRAALILVEGPQAVRELVRHRAGSVRDVYLTEAAALLHPDVVTDARKATRWVHTVTPQVASAMSGDAQGILAVADAEAIRASWDPQTGQWPATTVILAQGRDPGNVGTIIRTADAMGAQAVVAVAGTVDVTSPKVIRSSAGSLFHIPVLSAPSVHEAIAALRCEGHVALGTSGGHGSVDLSDLMTPRSAAHTALRGPHSWVLGNEAQGLSQEELAACDLLVRIPMSGHAESLNVASAASICLFASQWSRDQLL